MRHTVVARVALLLGGLFVVAALLFAWRAATAEVGRPAVDAPRPPTPLDVASGAAAFERRCAACHDPEDAAAPLRADSDRPVAVLRTLEFLRRHGRSAPEEDGAILLYLLSTLRDR